MKNVRKQKTRIKRSVKILLILGLSLFSVACGKDEQKKDDKKADKCVKDVGLEGEWKAKSIFSTNSAGLTQDLLAEEIVVKEVRKFSLCVPKKGKFCDFESRTEFPFSEPFIENGEYKLTKDLKTLVYKTSSGGEVFFDSSDFKINPTCDEFTVTSPKGAEEGEERTVSTFLILL